MASARCVAECLAMLSEAKPEREITEHTVAVYAMALDDVDDAALRRAAARALKICRFFPAPAELREYAGANVLPVVDVDAILEQLRGMCGYLPTVGTIAPRVDDVRQRLGDGIARAYAACGGGTRLLLGNDTTTAIALREFTQELQEEVRAVGPAALLPPAPAAALTAAPTTRGLLRD